MEYKNISFLKVVVILSVLVAFTFSPSCRKGGPFKGYATTNTGLYYKIISFFADNEKDPTHRRQQRNA